MEDYSTWRCPNTHCVEFGKPDVGQIRLAGWSGKGKRIRMLRCSTCGTTFSERRWTIHHGSRLSEDTDMQILRAYVEGGSIRGISRETGISRATIRRKIKSATRLMRMEELYERKRKAQGELNKELERLGLAPGTGSNIEGSTQQQQRPEESGRPAVQLNGSSQGGGNG